jgi:pimeloyl-ACP methyl ester carboxylesterase
LLQGHGYRVLCPDLRGAGWSSAPRDRYFKADMAEDLATVLDRLGVEPVRLVAHDWGGPVAVIMMLHHPEKVSGFFGLNTAGPWSDLALAFARNLWRFWYQIPIALPVVGPRVIGDPKGRFMRLLCRWGGGGFLPPDFDLYIRLMGEPGRAVAQSRWYRSFQLRELIRWVRGEYGDARVDVPVRFLHGMADPVVTPVLLRGFEERCSDFKVEKVVGVGHWIVEQQPELVLDRLGAGNLSVETAPRRSPDRAAVAAALRAQP